MKCRGYAILCCIGLLGWGSGCQDSKPTTTASTTTTSTETNAKTLAKSKSADDHDHDHDHDHGEGPHGGTVFEFGKHHAEFTVDHAKQQATVYILSGSLKKAVPIFADKLTLTLKDPPCTIELKAQPLDGEPMGRSSRFVGTHPNLGKEQEFAGTVSDGQGTTGNFQEKPHAEKPKDKN